MSFAIDRKTLTFRKEDYDNKLRLPQQEVGPTQLCLLT